MSSSDDDDGLPAWISNYTVRRGCDVACVLCRYLRHNGLNVGNIISFNPRHFTCAQSPTVTGTKHRNISLISSSDDDDDIAGEPPARGSPAEQSPAQEEQKTAEADLAGEIDRDSTKSAVMQRLRGVMLMLSMSACPLQMAHQVSPRRLLQRLANSQAAAKRRGSRSRNRPERQQPLRRWQPVPNSGRFRILLQSSQAPLAERRRVEQRRIPVPQQQQTPQRQRQRQQCPSSWR